MVTGKLSADHLVQLLDEYKGAIRPDVLMAGKLGEDCSYIKVADQTLVLSTDPVTAAESDLGTIAFNINMNDIATSGAEGVGLLITILLPPDSEKKILDTIMKELHDLCLAHNIQILGGHTEVTDSVNRPIVSVTAVGRIPYGEEIYSKGLKVGDSLVVSKALGIEGTMILADVRKDTAKKVLTQEELTLINGFKDQMSVIPEGRIGKKLGVHSMHDITEGGILGGVYEVVKASEKGCELFAEAFPFHDLTLKLTKALGLDEKKLISSGAMLFGTDEPERLIKELKEHGIPATVIGLITEGTDMWLIDGDKKIPLEAVAKDEIYRVFER